MEFQETVLPDFSGSVTTSRIVLAEDIEPATDGEYIGPGTKDEYEKFEREEKGMKNIFGLDDK